MYASPLNVSWVGTKAQAAAEILGNSTGTTIYGSTTNKLLVSNWKYEIDNATWYYPTVAGTTNVNTLTAYFRNDVEWFNTDHEFYLLDTRN